MALVILATLCWGSLACAARVHGVALTGLATELADADCDEELEAFPKVTAVTLVA